ncbi:MAG TPA: 1-deoxy-D-xylulose-5-phosphate reductoisomerase [Acidimicrobiales bacterium]|nr:1-deoxy-D-xylulose-5-phosphate reductoisomerase [Acidimicrobiales bacterium]
MPVPRRNVYIAGSTGSIGRQALEVIAAAPERFGVSGLGAGSDVKALAAQAAIFRPRRLAIADAAKGRELAALAPPGTEVLAGEGALAALVEDADIVLNSVVGFAALPVTLAALRSGRRLALANKESLIAGGPVVKRAWAASTGDLVPVDSEHCAVHQCLRSPSDGAARLGGRDVRRLVITASGGPFRGRSRHELGEVTVADALAHPTWRMGPKITVDSSTLMNKGLEVIEAHLLFDVGYDQIAVVVHPQSVVHSMVEYSDGATIAQLSLPDMRLPIGYALSYPERMATAYGAIDWARLGHLDFEPPDPRSFPCLELAYAAGRAGGTAPACLNGANEVAVGAFLSGRLRWVEIPNVISSVLARFVASEPRDVDDVLGADAEARALAAEQVRRLPAPSAALAGKALLGPVAGGAVGTDG